MNAVSSVAELLALSHQVLWAVFVVSVVFGWVAQQTHFCTMGALSDIVNMGDWSRMRMWGMAIGVSMLAFHLMAMVSLIDPSHTFYTAKRVVWLSALLGGGLFGVGMVLASGCGSKTLVRIGGGSLKSLVVFFVMGFAALVTLRGLTGVFRVRVLDTFAFDMAETSSMAAVLAGWTGIGSAPGWGVGVALVLLAWALGSRSVWNLPNLMGGVGVGLGVAAMWWITGYMGFVAEHPETLDPVHVATNNGQMESFTFTAPMAYLLEFLGYYSDTTKLLTTGVVSVLGVVAGSFVYSMMTRSFRWEGFGSTQDTALHLVGAVFMGVGGVTALGCTVGQGLSGISTLSLTSALAFTGIVVGGLAGLRFQLWLVMRD